MHRRRLARAASLTPALLLVSWGPVVAVLGDGDATWVLVAAAALTSLAILRAVAAIDPEAVVLGESGRRITIVAAGVATPVVLVTGPPGATVAVGVLLAGAVAAWAHEHYQVRGKLRIATVIAGLCRELPLQWVGERGAATVVQSFREQTRLSVACSVVVEIATDPLTMVVAVAVGAAAVPEPGWADHALFVVAPVAGCTLAVLSGAVAWERQTGIPGTGDGRARSSERRCPVGEIRSVCLMVAVLAAAAAAVVLAGSPVAVAVVLLIGSAVFRAASMAIARRVALHELCRQLRNDAADPSPTASERWQASFAVAIGRSGRFVHVHRPLADGSASAVLITVVLFAAGIPWAALPVLPVLLRTWWAPGRPTGTSKSAAAVLATGALALAVVGLTETSADLVTVAAPAGVALGLVPALDRVVEGRARRLRLPPEAGQ